MIYISDCFLNFPCVCIDRDINSLKKHYTADISKTFILKNHNSQYLISLGAVPRRRACNEATAPLVAAAGWSAGPEWVGRVGAVRSGPQGGALGGV